MTVLIPDRLDFLPLFDESEESVWTRMSEWANEGVEPTDPTWTDTREGSFFWMNTRPGAREIARLYDLAGSEAPASSMPLWTWGPYLDSIAAVYELERTKATSAVGTVTFHAPEDTVIPAGTEVSTVPVEGSGIEPVDFIVVETGTVGGAGTVSLAVQATNSGSSGNVAAGAITNLDSQVPGVTAISNTDATFGGSDEEGDESLKERLLEVFAGNPTANVYWYLKVVREWLQANDGLRCPLGGRVTVIPLWEGAGTILIVATDDAGNELEPEVVEHLEEYLDPGTGQNHGVGSVGAEITVKTATNLEVTVGAKITFEAAYNLDGAHSLIGLSEVIEDAVRNYIDGLGSGEEVVWTKVIAAIVEVVGVKDVSEVKLNGHEESLHPTETPPQVARLHAVAFTDAEPGKE